MVFKKCMVSATESAQHCNPGCLRAGVTGILTGFESGETSESLGPDLRPPVYHRVWAVGFMLFSRADYALFFMLRFMLFLEDAYAVRSTACVRVSPTDGHTVCAVNHPKTQSIILTD